MWYPSQQQQQQHSWYGYANHHHSSQQQQQTYSRTSYYSNGDELPNTCTVATNDENESPIHCQTTYSVTAPDCYVTTSTNSYGDEMSSYQTTPTRKAHWNPVIVAPTKMSTVTIKNTPINIPSLPVPTSTPDCWDWLLFSPQYYSEFYTPSSTSAHQQQKSDEENNDDIDSNILASLPTCLLALLYLTPKLIRTSNDENDSDQEINSLHITDEALLSMNNIEKKITNISSNLSLSSDHKNSNLNIDGQNRSSTPDTDDGYQSASDASRSDYSQQCKDDITINEHSLIVPRRITYAAAVKPIISLTNIPTPISGPKQIMNNTLPTTAIDTNGQKVKFFAPRFERMHHAKQYSTSSNRTQTRSTNNNQRTQIVNSTRRR